MLGLLEVSGKVLRVQSRKIKLMEQTLLWVTIPKIKRRYLKKAAKLLTGTRTIVWEKCNLDCLRTFGINPVPSGRIYKYVADKVFIKTLEISGMSQNTKVAIYTGWVGAAEKRQIANMIKKLRHIFVRAGNMKEISNWLMENYGVSSMENMKKPDITIFMYEENFSLHFVKNGCKYTLEGVDFIDNTDIGIKNDYIKSAYVALINIGILNPKDIDIRDMTFRREKLT